MASLLASLMKRGESDDVKTLRDEVTILKEHLVAKEEEMQAYRAKITTAFDNQAAKIMAKEAALEKAYGDINTLRGQLKDAINEVEMIKDNPIIKEVPKEVFVEVMREVEVVRNIPVPAAENLDAVKYRFIKDNYRRLNFLWEPGSSGDIVNASLGKTLPLNIEKFDDAITALMTKGRYS